jgi:arylsulfatase A-like enzyme
MKRTRIVAALVSIVVGIFTFLLLPASSRKYAILFDENQIRRKQEYLAGVAAAAGTDEVYNERPNIVLILADDLGYADISLTGSTLVETPHIDSIGTGGVVFTNAYCSSSICAPSRASMLTGRYQQRSGFELQPNSRYAANRLEYLVFKHILDIGFWKVADLAVPKKADREKQGVPPSELMLSELLGAAGYSTGIIGKWHLGAGDGFIPNDRGFDYQYGFYEAYTLYADPDNPEIINNRLDEFSDRHQWRQGRKGSSAVRINDEVIEEDGYLTDRIADETIDFIRSNSNRPFFAYVPFNAPHVPYQAPSSYYERMDHIEDFTARVYNAMIKSLDDAVGRILDELDAQGIAENTLVIFASDNGGTFFTGSTDNGGLKGGKFTNFDGGLKVPFMMRWPGRIGEGTIFEPQVGLFDAYSTAAAAAGMNLSGFNRVDGVNLLEYISGDNETPHEFLFWRTLYNKAVRKGQYKLIVNELDSSRFLYDTMVDPEERHNLIDKHPEIVSELIRALAEWETGLVEPLWPRVMDAEFLINGELYRFAI